MRGRVYGSPHSRKLGQNRVFYIAACTDQGEIWRCIKYALGPPFRAKFGSAWGRAVGAGPNKVENFILKFPVYRRFFAPKGRPCILHSNKAEIWHERLHRYGFTHAGQFSGWWINMDILPVLQRLARQCLRFRVVTARRHAIARYMLLSVCLSLRHKPALYQNR